jgi:hypothetical protein
MKPLLRVVLVVNALIFLAFGVLFLLTPWGSLWDSMHLVRVQPPLVGQLLGVALIGFAWLGFHAAIDGALTATAAKVSGHVEWLSGLVLIVWLGLRMSEVTGFGQLLAALIGVALLILGLGSVRLSSVVRRRERAAIAGAAAAERAEKQAAKTRAEERAAAPAVTPVRAPMTSDPVAPANPRWDAEPVAGAPLPSHAPLSPLSPSTASRPSAATFDPATGHAIDPTTGRSLDPVTGRAFEPVSTGHKIDPETGRAIDPVTGQTIDPLTGAPVRRDPH